MAKGRMLNRTISTSAKFQMLPDDTCRLLATWTISHLDTNGVFHGEPALVKSLIFPYRADVTTEQVREYLQAMQRVGLIVLFVVNRTQYQVWTGFDHNQPYLRKDREGKTDFPTPPADLSPAGNPLPDSLPTNAGVNPPKGKEEKGKEENTFPPPPAADIADSTGQAIATPEALKSEAVLTWRRKIRRPLTPEAANYIFGKVTDIPQWCEVLDCWLINNYKEDNVMGQVSMYDGWATDRRNPNRNGQPQSVAVSAPPPIVEWVTTPKGKVLRYEGQPYPGAIGRQKCEELGIAYEGN